MIREFVKAAGINSVIWIDDFFARPSRDVLEDRIRRSVFGLKEADEPLVYIGSKGVIDLTKSRHEIEENCDELLGVMSDDEIEGVLQQIGTSAQTEVEIPADLSSEDFTALKAAFGTNLQTFSLREWTSGASAKFQSAANNTLFLIDKQFTREDTTFDGVVLLRDMVGSTEAMCILLTHTCAVDEQNRERLNIAQESEGKVPSYRFFVVSKQQRGEGSIEERFARAIYAVMTHRFTGEIAELMRKCITASASETANRLTSQSVFELDLVFFENSNREGVPEYDVLIRIFSIEQRQAMNAALLYAPLQDGLRRARKFRKDTASLRGTWKTGDLDLDAFRKWRKCEVFEEGAGLNAIHAPLRCGDVFMCEASKENYVFLAQPCDLMVRHNGRRTSQVGLFVLAIEGRITDDATQPSGHRFFDIKGVFGPAENWRLDFQNTIAVDVSIVDLAVFNVDGSVRLHRNQPEPSILLTPGWLNRMNRAKQQFFGNDAPSTAPGLAVGTKAARFKGKFENDAISYPVVRIGRFDTNTATAILAAWATFQTRAALEHDFAFMEANTK